MTPLAVICALSAFAGADTPRIAWSYAVRSNLYAAPVAADLRAEPGLETIVCDSEARTVHCVSAGGQELWKFCAPWTKRQASSAAVSMNARAGAATAAVANGDGLLFVLDASTGRPLWNKRVTRVDRGGLLWCDLGGDGRDELVVCGDDGVARAFDAAGNPAWSSDTTAPTVPGRFTGPLAAADIDGDGASELVGVTEWGAACLGGGGSLRWKCEPVARCIGAPIVYRTRGGVCVAFVSRVPPAVYAVRADTGEELWRGTLLDAPDDYSASALAAGDLDDDGVREVVACDARGHVHCFADGALRWVFETQKAANGMATIGDATGDGVPEVLVASGDRSLYCIDAGGALLWRYEAGMRLLHPPTVCDVDADGLTDILLGGGDRALRCFATDAAYRADAVPWPSRRGDASLSGAALSSTQRTARRARLPRHRRDDERVRGGRIDEYRDVLRDGGFERATVASGPPGEAQAVEQCAALRALPNGWVRESVGGEWARETARAREGAACLRMDAGTMVVSQPVRLDGETVAVRATVYASGDDDAGARATLRWTGAAGVVCEDALRADGTDAQGWRRFATTERKRPRGARYVQLALHAERKSVWWDEAHVAAHLRRVPRIDVFANQVGYDLGAPKRSTVASSFPFDAGTFALIGSDGATVFRGTVPRPARIIGAYDSDWGEHYAQADFSAFDTPGTYAIRVTVNGVAGVSHPFVVAQDALWEATARPAYRFFYYQRCGCEVPGFHAACHLDDAVGASGKQYNLWGGWHDAGDYNTYTNAPYAFGMFQAYYERRAQWDRRAWRVHGSSGIVSEALWGTDHTRRMIMDDGSACGDISSGYEYWGPPELETDNELDSGDERAVRGPESGIDPGYHVAAMAAAWRCTKDPSYRNDTLRAYDYRARHAARDALQLSAAIDLFAATGEARFADDARAIVSAGPPDDAEVLRRYDAAFGTDHGVMLHSRAIARADAMLAAADNPFGVYMFGTKEQLNYFGTPADRGGWHVGTSSHLLGAAAAAAEAYRYTGEPKYLVFAYDQLNWELGCNPYGVCLMEGVGSVNLPSYHNRIAAAGVPRGAVPGSVVNGTTWRTPGDDRPYLDMRGIDVPDFEPNEPWLPHNVNYLKAIANICAARDAQDGGR